MNLLDLVIVLAALGAGLGGYRLGLLTRATAWAGMVLGIMAAARVAPGLNRRFGGLDPNRALLLSGLALLSGAFLGQLVGQLVGQQLRARNRSPKRARIDQVAGAGSGVVVILAAVWLLAPTMAAVPNWPADLVHGSRLAREIDRFTPDPPDPLRAASQLIGNQEWQELTAQFAGGLPGGEVPAEGPAPAGLDQAIRAATVRVVHEVCNSGSQEGTGFVAAAQLVVTNAHVVAGEPNHPVVVQDENGRSHRARVVHFDPREDLAILRVESLEAVPLPLAERANRNEMGWVYGHPGGRALEVREFLAGSEIVVRVPDIYGGTDVERAIVPIRAELERGDSGSALVARSGLVIGVAFAIAPDDGGGRPEPLAVALTMGVVNAALGQAVALGPDAPEVGTGACLPTATGTRS
ncbi:MAG: CvpA family protein [Acidimicrobiales bacterium]